ncbi:MAG: hypothetical protein ABIT09_02945 [Croceibacterium sp.]
MPAIWFSLGFVAEIEELALAIRPGCLLGPNFGISGLTGPLEDNSGEFAARTADMNKVAKISRRGAYETQAISRFVEPKNI